MDSPVPLVSVILPTRDRLDLLRRALASVRGQSEQRFEVIVVDDCSSDGTHEYLAQLAEADARVRVVRTEMPSGGGGARNQGIRLSRAPWVAFIDDDDEWMPHKLAAQLRTLEAHPQAVACSCNFLVVRSETGASQLVNARVDVTLQELLAHNWLGGASACLCASEPLHRIGGFDIKLRAAQDLDLWVRLRQQGDIAVCREPLVMHRAHTGPRITTNAHAQYVGARRFHLKYRYLMSAATRRHRISHSCFVMSTESRRGLSRRLHFLAIALRNSTLRFSLAYLRRSVPLLLRDALRGASLLPAHATSAHPSRRSDK